MKLNRKGFMMVEVIITSSVVAVVLITLYIGISRINNAYNKRNKYYDLDSQQVAMEINNLLRRNDIDINGYNNYKVLYNEINDLTQIYSNQFETKVQAYLIKNSQGLNTLKSNIASNITFTDYLEYYTDKYNIDDYTYFIVVQLQKQDNYYYYTLKVKE